MKGIITLAALLFSLNAFCKMDSLRVKSKISDVTVFFSGAQVKRQVDLKIGRGQYMIVVDKLPQEINPQSIQIKAPKNSKILSVKHMNSKPDEGRKSNTEKDIQLVIDRQFMVIKEIKNKLNVFDIEEKLLMDNSKLSQKNDGSSINDLKAAADFYRTRINEIRQSKLGLNVELDSSVKKIENKFKELNEITVNKNKSYSKILVAIETKSEIVDGFELTYYIKSAGWEPLYDFRVDDITKPFVIVYNANVFQSSGEDWNNVNIRLSTSDPSLSGDKPDMQTWYFGTKLSLPSREIIENGIGAIKGRVSEPDGKEAIPFASVSVQLNGVEVLATSTDFEGQFSLKPLPSGKYDIKVSSVGYSPQLKTGVVVSKGTESAVNFQLQKGAELSAVEIEEYSIPLVNPGTPSSQKSYSMEHIQASPTRSINAVVSQSAGVNQSGSGSYSYYNDTYLNSRGSRRDATNYIVDGNAVRGIETTNYISNSLRSSVANIEYVIDIPYTILSDGEDYNIKIKESSIPVTYLYFTTPKLDDDAFLVAEVTDWTQLNLLSGKSSIYYQGTFTGQSFIDSEQASDTLRVSLGRDKDIFVKREGNKKVFDKRSSGSNIKETIGWDITVKNNKNAKIKIIIEDQIPVTQNKAVEIEKLESLNAVVDERNGKLTWELQLDPGERKINSFKYSVKYPKYMVSN